MIKTSEISRSGRYGKRRIRRTGRLAAGMAIAAVVCLLVGCHRRAPITADGKSFEPIAVLGGPGLTPGKFHIPRSIATDGRFIYVVDKAARIQKLDPDTGTCLAWWRTPKWELGKPNGITIAPAPRAAGLPPGTPVLWVADTHYNRILIYALATEGDDQLPAPTPSKPATDKPAAIASMFPKVDEGPPELHPPVLAEFGTYGTGPGQFIYLTDVAVQLAADGKTVERMYTTEYGGSDRIQCFDGDFNPLWQVGTIGASDTADNVQMERPQCIRIDSTRQELIITDTRNHRIGRFTMDGKLVAWFGSTQAAGVETFKYPWTLQLMGDGTALVVEFGNNRLNRVDLSTGKSLGTIGRPGRNPGEFAAPWSIAVKGDRTFIVDQGNHRIQVLKTPPKVSQTAAVER